MPGLVTERPPIRILSRKPSKIHKLHIHPLNERVTDIYTRCFCENNTDIISELCKDLLGYSFWTKLEDLSFLKEKETIQYHHFVH